MSAMDFTVRPVTSAQWPALEDLFGRSGASNGCWCMYWRIGPRYRVRPRADNKEDLRQLAASGRPPGLLAFDGARAVGWCELAPRAELAWLARARYLGPVDDLPVWSVPCFYVRSSHRGRGVMDALIEHLGLPLAVKPAKGGSALGFSVVRTREQLPSAMVACFSYGPVALVERFVDHMMDERFSELARKPDAKFLGAGVSNSSLSRGVSTFTMGAGVQDGKIEDGATALATEAKRVREFGFSASEMDRAKKWMASFYERAYSERDKTESGQFAEEYVRNFLNDEPAPGIEYEYKLVQQVLPGITVNEASAMAKALLVDNSRVVLAVSPQKPDIRIPTDAQLQAAFSSGAFFLTPGQHSLTTVALDAQSFTDAVAAVTNAALTFLVCHNLQVNLFYLHHR
jgi:GNAT superfamily N-acetyltransferase